MPDKIKAARKLCTSTLLLHFFFFFLALRCIHNFLNFTFNFISVVFSTYAVLMSARTVALGQMEDGGEVIGD